MTQEALWLALPALLEDWARIVRGETRRVEMKRRVLTQRFRSLLWLGRVKIMRPD
jgi:hypothetical protein